MLLSLISNSSQILREKSFEAKKTTSSDCILDAVLLLFCTSKLVELLEVSRLAGVVCWD